MHWIEVARKVTEDKQAYEHEGMLLDLMTASVLVQIYDALNEKNRAKFHDLELIRAVDISWKLAYR